MSPERRPTGSFHAFLPRLLAVAVAISLLLVAALSTDAASATPYAPTATASATCKVPKVTRLTLKQATAKLKAARCGTPRVKNAYSTKVKGGRVISQSPKAGKRLKGKGRVTLTVSLGKKLCVVKKRNANGKLVTVYLTKLVRKKVRLKSGKIVTRKVRVFVYRIVTKKVKVNGKTRIKRIKVKIPKTGPCKKNTKSSPGVPVNITLVDPSDATIDFGAFQRDIPLTGTAGGFILGKGFVLGQENLIQITRAHINLTPTGIFIDDACNGQVSDSIRTGSGTFTELDQTSTGNTITVKKDGSLSGLLHMRVQVSLQLRNDDTGCNDPYLTTGWTDFTVPLFIKGKIGPGKGGLTSTLTIGETVLDDLSACLAVGDPTLPCNGFAIPFPGILSAALTTLVKIG